MINMFTLLGRIVDDPIINEDKSILVKIAVSRSYKNAEGVYETDYIDFVANNGIAETTAEYCKKGDLIGVKGRFETKDNKLNLVAEKVTFLSSKNINKDMEREER